MRNNTKQVPHIRTVEKQEENTKNITHQKTDYKGYMKEWEKNNDEIERTVQLCKSIHPYLHAGV